MTPRKAESRQPDGAATSVSARPRRLRLVVDEFAPQPADQAEAIAAAPLHARLVVIGRAGPMAGRGYDFLARREETLLAFKAKKCATYRTASIATYRTA